MATLTSQNPYTGEINKTFETVSNEQLTALIGQAHQTYLSWKNTPVAEKKKLFLRMADILDERNAEYALLETREMGSLWSFSKNVLKGTANLIRRNANNAESILGTEMFDAE
ncbi:aldehyde dehydrogenase [Patescibacteria group bacterium]|nr:aldehyde dehydrogenase [Patescibacteria group bacterium]